jgi:hypothetical protein
LLQRPLLAAEYWTRMKSIWPLTPVSRESTFRFWDHGASTIIFLNTFLMQFYYENGLHKLWKFRQNL